MFAKIKTEGATHILIHVPGDAAAKSLPALAAMLEENAVFIRDGYSKYDIVEPKMEIVLGNKVTLESYEGEALTVAAGGSVIDDGFEIATPDVLASNRKGIEKKNAEIAKLRAELAFVKSQLDERERHALNCADAASDEDPF